MGTEAEVIIAGGGVAGLALALQLGGRGRAVVVIDKAEAPRDKVCGEGLMPLGMAALREIGLDPHGLPGGDFCGVEYHTRSQTHRLNFAEGAMGRGIRRTDLISALQDAALAQPGVTLCRDEIVQPLWRDGRIVGVRGREGEYRGRAVVAADGVQSQLAHAAGMRRRRYGYRMGLRRHYRLKDPHPPRRVRIGLFAPCDVYLTPVGGGCLLATTMTTRAGYDAVWGDYEAFLAGTPFAPVFQDAEPVSELLGWYHPLYSHAGFERAGMLLVGDAAGSLDPCLGMGISMALTTSRLACEAVTVLLEKPETGTAWSEGYETACRSLFRHYRIFDYIFRLMVITKLRGEILLWGMRHWPEVSEAILEIVARRSPWRGLPLRSLLFPGRGGGRR